MAPTLLARAALALLPLAAATASLPVSAAPSPGGGPACPRGMVCESTLGIAIRPAQGWTLLPAGKYPPHVLAFGIPPRSGPDYTMRLIIEPYAIASAGSEAQTARLVAGKIIRADRAQHATMRPITIGGSAGALVRGLPGDPTPAADIFLAHGTFVYQIIAPGPALGADQRAALATLRFIPRSGNFLPPAYGSR